MSRSGASRKLPALNVAAALAALSAKWFDEATEDSRQSCFFFTPSMPPPIAGGAVKAVVLWDHAGRALSHSARTSPPASDLASVAPRILRPIRLFCSSADP